MSRGTAADNSLTPPQLDRLYRTAARIDESHLQTKHENESILMAFLIYMLGYLGFRLGFVLHFDQDDVVRDDDGEIIAVRVPIHKDCERTRKDSICSHCKELAKARARYADDDDVTAEDFYDEYWSPKSEAGCRKIPVRHKRGKKIIELFLETHGSLVMADETVRRRLTRLAELTEGVEPDQMMPQALRASAANYWMAFDEFDVDGLQILMGWKYLSTAQYYMPTTFDKLWTMMGRCVGKGEELAYDMDRQPETYSEIRDSGELISLKKITPNSDIVRHEYADHPNPLEAEAKEYQTNISDEEFAARIPDPVTPVTTWCMDFSDRVTDRGAEWWDNHIPHAPLDWTLRSRWRRVVFFFAVAVPALVWLGADLAEVGFRIDVWEQEVSVSREALTGFALLTYAMHTTLKDDWDEIEDGLRQAISDIRGAE